MAISLSSHQIKVTMEVTVNMNNDKVKFNAEGALV